MNDANSHADLMYNDYGINAIEVNISVSLVFYRLPDVDVLYSGERNQKPNTILCQTAFILQNITQCLSELLHPRTLEGTLYPSLVCSSLHKHVQLLISLYLARKCLANLDLRKSQP